MIYVAFSFIFMIEMTSRNKLGMSCFHVLLNDRGEVQSMKPWK